MVSREDCVNFGAGPCALATNVLEEAARGLLNYNNTGVGVAELSHRSSEFIKIADECKSNMRKMFNVPETHEILYFQGGGTMQFSAVIYNMLNHWYSKHHGQDGKPVMDYVITGKWSESAAKEADRICTGQVHKVIQRQKPQKYDHIPLDTDWKFSKDAAFVYYCDNETVDGIEFEDSFPYDRLPEGALLVGDISSNALSRFVDISKHAVIFAGAQKNIGPAGLTFVIVRKDLLVNPDEAAKLGAPVTPKYLDYRCAADNDSMYNTPPCFPIYVAGLVLEDLLATGGLRAVSERSNRKASLLYDCIDSSKAYSAKVVKGSRSRMNVVFEVLEGRESEFLDLASTQGFKQLKGHRSVGGVRASLYNAITIEDVESLVKFMTAFAENKAA